MSGQRGGEAALSKAQVSTASVYSKCLEQGASVQPRIKSPTEAEADSLRSAGPPQPRGGA